MDRGFTPPHIEGPLAGAADVPADAVQPLDDPRGVRSLVLLAGVQVEVAVLLLLRCVQRLLCRGGQASAGATLRVSWAHWRGHRVGRRCGGRGATAAGRGNFDPRGAETPGTPASRRSNHCGSPKRVTWLRTIRTWPRRRSPEVEGTRL